MDGWRGGAKANVNVNVNVNVNANAIFTQKAPVPLIITRLPTFSAFFLKKHLSHQNRRNTSNCRLIHIVFLFAGECPKNCGAALYSAPTAKDTLRCAPSRSIRVNPARSIPGPSQSSPSRTSQHRHHRRASNASITSSFPPPSHPRFP